MVDQDLGANEFTFTGDRTTVTFFPVAPGPLHVGDENGELIYQGIEGDHGIAYLVLAACLNFALFFAASYYIFGLFTKPKDSN